MKLCYRLPALILCRILPVIFAVLLYLAQASPARATPPGRPYDDLLNLVLAHALMPPDGNEQWTYLRTAPRPEYIRKFLRSFDQYAAYLTAREYADLLKAQQTPSAGVGMDIVHDAERNIVCIPYAGFEAAYKGVRYGDILLAVDGESVKGMELDEVGRRIRGLEDSVLTLTVGTREGPASLLVLSRKKFHPPSVAWDEPVLGTPCIRIYRFGPDTARELQRLLAEKPLKRELVVDLRGNTGGDMKAGIDAARLFLPRGVALIRTRSRKGESVIKTEAPGPYADRRAIIWQDELTASAAEIFIAALHHTGRAITVGRPSAGKAMSQQLFKLPGGGLLKLTTEALLLPDGSGTWQDTGLLPDLNTSRRDAGREEYERMTPEEE